MKVFEKCNEVKGTDATIEQIAAWAYNNEDFRERKIVAYDNRGREERRWNNG